jgi:hypothetical protein
VPFRKTLRGGYTFNAVLFLACTFVVSCSARFPAVMIIQGNKVLRGSASGHSGQDVIFRVTNADGFSCEGSMFVLPSDAHTEGTIDCDNQRKGHFIANSKTASWVGEGKMDDGSKFVISIGR